MKTLFLLMAQYDGASVLPLETVCRDFFTHLKPEHFMRKIGCGEIALPILRMDDGVKSARGVHLEDLAAYIETRKALARRELHQMTK